MTPHVLLAHRFYSPDVTTYAQMLEMMAQQLERSGMQTTVFSSQPSYNNVYQGDPLPRLADEAGVSVIRKQIPGGGSTRGRFFGGLLFGLLLVAHCARHRGKYDSISVSTVPPVAMGLFGVVAARFGNAKLVYHCMDLYPEIALAAGMAQTGLRSRIAERLDMITVSHAAAVVVLSRDMADTLQTRGHDTNNIVILNNFVIGDGASTVSLDPEFVRTEPSFRVIFAGNLGRFQGLESLLEGFLLAYDQNPSLEMCFLGAGALEQQLRDQAGQHVGGAVKFWDHRPLDSALGAIADADLAVVSLGPGLIGSAYPSKTIMYLETGSRILGIVELESELAEMIEAELVGTVVPPGDTDAVCTAILSEADRGTAYDSSRSKAAASRLFGVNQVLPKWSDLYSRLNSREGPVSS